jgi:hypothetical protein
MNVLVIIPRTKAHNGKRRPSLHMEQCCRISTILHTYLAALPTRAAIQPRTSDRLIPTLVTDVLFQPLLHRQETARLLQCLYDQPDAYLYLYVVQPHPRGHSRLECKNYRG